MVERKADFIHDRCELCSKQEIALSVLRLCCGYGSLNDSEDITLNICGDCADRIYAIIQNQKGIKKVGG